MVELRSWRVGQQGLRTGLRECESGESEKEGRRNDHSGRRSRRRTEGGKVGVRRERARRRRRNRRLKNRMALVEKGSNRKSEFICVVGVVLGTPGQIKNVVGEENVPS